MPDYPQQVAALDVGNHPVNNIEHPMGGKVIVGQQMSADNAQFNMQRQGDEALNISTAVRGNR